MGMPSELKVLIRNRKYLILRQGILYKKTKVNARTKHLLVVPQAYRQRAIEGCHDQLGHLGQDRVLDLPRDRFYWPGCMLMWYPTSKAAPDVCIGSPSQTKLDY